MVSTVRRRSVNAYVASKYIMIRHFRRKLVNNHTFFQHPDLIRVLRIHENVMAIMMNTLGRRAQAQSDVPQTTEQGGEAPAKEKDTSHEMVVACCRFLCYFCRTSRQNQKAMFDHLAFLLENSNILLSRPSLRGSTPLDVAYSSVMENTELALALRYASAYRPPFTACFPYKISTLQGALLGKNCCIFVTLRSAV